MAQLLSDGRGEHRSAASSTYSRGYPVFLPTGSAQIGQSNYQTATLEDWQAALWTLYGRVDQLIPMHDMMLQFVGDSTRLAEAIRKRNYNEALPVMARLFSWLNAMVSKVAVQNREFSDLGDGKSLADIIWQKYPRMCSFCRHSECYCPVLYVDDQSPAERARRRREEQIASQSAQHIGQRPRTLDAWIEMFESVYGGANRTRSVSDKTFHFLEEVGEIEIELRAAERIKAGIMAPRPIEWEDEVADVFSWLSAIYLHVRGYVDRANGFVMPYHATSSATQGEGSQGPLAMPTFSEIVWREFRGTDSLVCHRCGLPECDLTQRKGDLANVAISDPVQPIRVPPRR